MTAVRVGRSGRLREAGQSMAEMALLCGFLLVLVAGSIDIGRYAQFSIVVANGARAGVQYGSLNPVTALDYSGMASAATANASNLPGITASGSSYCTCADGSTVSCTPTACSANHRILNVKTTVSATFKTLFRYPFISHQITVTRSAIEQVPQ